jgi:SP family general alpha glucoside:H+ symporter-like MFS transporter
MAAPSAQVPDAVGQESRDQHDNGVKGADETANLSEKDAKNTIIDHARAAATNEQNMTLLQGIKLYPKAIFWSILISTCIVMEGYDISLVNNFCMPLLLNTP